MLVLIVYIAMCDYRIVLSYHLVHHTGLKNGILFKGDSFEAGSSAPPGKSFSQLI